MRLIHTSDWHLGMTFRGGMSFSSDQKYAVDGIIKIAEEERADGILIAGDVFDKSIASQDAIRIYDSIVTHICGDLGIAVYIIAGNHDGAERISQCSALLKKSGLYIAGALTKELQRIESEDTDIYLLPWISTDKVKTLFPEKAEEISSMEDAYRVVLDRYREHFQSGKRNILLSHAYIIDAETSVSDIAAEVGRAAAVGADVFRGFDYVALGHLHGPQDIRDNIRYSGSLMTYSFGKEEKQVKSVTLIDTLDMSRKIIPIPQLHKRVTLKGSYDELMEADFDEEILRGYVKLEVTDHFVGMDSMAAFREKYTNLLELSGKGLEHEDAKITMTIEEFESAGTDPAAVFTRYCRDIMGEEPTEHMEKLFRDAVSKILR